MLDSSIADSSNAVGIGAGIAELTCQANPGLTRDQLRVGLQQSGAFHPSRSSTMGFGLVNAAKAIGP